MLRNACTINKITYRTEGVFSVMNNFAVSPSVILNQMLLYSSVPKSLSCLFLSKFGSVYLKTFPNRKF
jgi:hypothetical protein